MMQILPETMLKGRYIERDIRGLISSGIEFHGGQTLGENLDLKDLLETCQAVYLTDPVPEQVYAEWIGNNGRELGYVQTNQITGHPQIFIGEEFLMNGITVVEAAARGRKAATNIWQFLNQMSN